MVHLLAVDHGVAAGLHGVQTRVWKTGRVITVPAEQSTQGAPSDLGQLLRGELEVEVSSLVPKPAPTILLHYHDSIRKKSRFVQPFLDSGEITNGPQIFKSPQKDF